MDRDAVRSKVRTAVRRGIGKVDRLDRVVTERTVRRDRLRRLVSFYDNLRTRLTDLPAIEPGALPTSDQVAHVERIALDGAATRSFVLDVVDSGEFGPGAVSLVRSLLGVDLGRARSISQVLQRDPATRAIGDVCQAIVVASEPLLDTSWRLLTRNDPAVVLHLAPADYFRVGFQVDPGAATDMLRRVLAGEFRTRLTNPQWLEFARASLLAGDEVAAAGAADRAARNQKLRGQVDAVRAWFGRRELARDAVDIPAGTVAIGVLDPRLPGRPDSPPSRGDALNTLAALGNLVRHSGVRLAGDPELVALAETLRTHVVSHRAIVGEDASAQLVRVDRAASEFDALPDNTWLLASGTFIWKPGELHRTLPLSPRVRPVFVGFYTEPWALNGDGVVEYLREHAPIGCRDWQTVFLLQAAGIPAFFSGWILDTLDTIAGAGTPLPDQAYAQALDDVRALATGHSDTSDLRTYLAARAVGGDPDFHAKHPGDLHLDGLVDIPRAEFERQRERLLDIVATAFSAIVAGKSVDEVYAAWRDACAPLVAEARARRDAPLPQLPPPSFDVGRAVRQVLDRRVVVERTEPAPDGSEINLELSLDGNYKHQLDVVLDSIVVNTTRPIRAFVLARDHSPADFDRMARLFPTVSFVWLPTDDADYGPISGMLRHITVATMDRLLLPDLLPDVDRILHHDLDALCLADLAELYDVPMGDAPIAARDQRHPFQGSGYISMTHGVSQVDTVERARELMLRVVNRHPFDYRTFNAGIMVLNLARMRADDFTNSYLPLIERFGFNDQGLLNLYAGSQHYEFDRAWNAYPRFELTDDAKILHWLGPWKPWKRPFIDGKPLWRAAEARVVKRERAAGLR